MADFKGSIRTRSNIWDSAICHSEPCEDPHPPHPFALPGGLFGYESSGLAIFTLRQIMAPRESLRGWRQFPAPRAAALLLTFFLLIGCGRLKQWAYEGVNRDEWQQPAKVVESLPVRPGDRVVDLGSGSGYFTFRLARAVGPTGKVYAVDVDPDVNQLVAERARQEGISNVEVILAQPADPNLPSSDIDLIFTANTYHHIDNRTDYFRKLRSGLRPDDRVAIIDFDRPSISNLWSHYTARVVVKSEMERAGYRLENEFDFLERQSFLVFAPEISPEPARREAPPSSRAE